ncbi:uncharacterized protein EKO05_0006564 [Ascochyta rabiei]|uniref:Uncharacterized protein n=1 Tax=Didymella rabiei TaxID=5454 RepID=A0A162W0U3_DIDRA|nr:uncharacterized protein EKO05_0006564 [Ascochyta rabiei]KZM18722.1 hypothetical protein ST47_g10077 [Ascochyta rabiei]UPX16146.1 hypothetical protein EKO05_0006564 [Ascochyta rabiei]
MGCGSSKQADGQTSAKKTRSQKRKTYNGGVSIHDNKIAGIGGGPGGPTAGGGGGVLGEDFGGGGDERFGVRSSGGR